MKIRNSLRWKIFLVILSIILAAVFFHTLYYIEKITSLNEKYYENKARLISREVLDLLDYADITMEEVGSDEKIMGMLRDICGERKNLLDISMSVIDETGSSSSLIFYADEESYRNYADQQGEEVSRENLSENEKKVAAGEIRGFSYMTEKGSKKCYVQAIKYDAAAKPGMIKLEFDYSYVKGIAMKNIFSETGIVVAAMLVMLILSQLFIHFLILRPLQLIGDHMREFARGNMNFEDRITLKRKDELACMAQDYNEMVAEIKSYAANIDTFAEKKQAVETEMRIAADIQRGLIPKGSFRGDGLIIDALMEPAKYVGGDFYDYFSVGSGKTAFLIADVSGKGTTAAILMSTTILSLRYYLKAGFGPARALYTVNNELLRNNAKGLFVTIFAGIYDRAEGSFTYSNAGHNPPYYMKADEAAPVELQGAAGCLLGIFRDEIYQESTVKIGAGDSLFLYTDGVNEALAEDGLRFGKERMERQLQLSAAQQQSPVKRILADIKTFRADTEQNDDITMLWVNFCGSEVKGDE